MWIKDLKSNSSPDIKIFLIGNKSDLEDEREIEKEEGEELKNKFEFDYFIETSAKTGKNVEEIFVHAAKLLYEDYGIVNQKKKKNKLDEAEKMKLNKDKVNSKKGEKKGCC